MDGWEDVPEAGWEDAPGEPVLGQALREATITRQPLTTGSLPFYIPEHLKVESQISTVKPIDPNSPIEPGNIDLHNRPVVRNPDGSISTVRSITSEFDGKHVVLPTVADDGRILSPQEANAQYLQSGRHLGVFDSAEKANAYAQKLHEDQAREYAAVVAPEVEVVAKPDPDQGPVDEMDMLRQAARDATPDPGPIPLEAQSDEFGTLDTPRIGAQRPIRPMNIGDPHYEAIDRAFGADLAGDNPASQFVSGATHGFELLRPQTSKWAGGVVKFLTDWATQDPSHAAPMIPVAIPMLNELAKVLKANPDESGWSPSTEFRDKLDAVTDSLDSQLKDRQRIGMSHAANAGEMAVMQINQVPAMAAAAAAVRAGAPAVAADLLSLGPMGLQALGSAYDRFSKKYTPDAAIRYATIETLLEVAPEKLALHQWMKLAEIPTGAGAAAVGKQFLRTWGVETTEEQITSVGEFVMDKLKHDPKRSFASLFEEMGSNAEMVAIMMPLLGAGARIGTKLAEHFTQPSVEQFARELEKASKGKWTDSAEQRAADAFFTPRQQTEEQATGKAPSAWADVPRETIPKGEANEGNGQEQATRAAAIEQALAQAVPGKTGIEDQGAPVGRAQESPVLGEALRDVAGPNEPFLNKLPEVNQVSRAPDEPKMLEPHLADEGKVDIRGVKDLPKSARPVSIQNDDEGDTPNSVTAFFDDDNEAHVRWALDKNGDVRLLGLYAEGAKVRGRAMVDWLREKYPNSQIIVHEVASDAMGFWSKMEDEGLIDHWTTDEFAGKTKPAGIKEGQTLGVREMPSKSPLISMVDKEEAAARIARREKRKSGIGEPKNPRIVLKKDGKEFVVGKPTFGDWVAKARSNLGAAEFKDARKWYRQLHDFLTPIYGEEAPKYALAWLLSQKNESPSGGMRNVLRAADEAAGKRRQFVPGLNAAALIQALKGEKIEAGVGAKLMDFVDSELGLPRRTWMNYDEKGRQPAAIDVWAFRDQGFVDTATKNFIAREYGQKAADRVAEDASFGETNYEYGIDYYNDLANFLNERNYDGGKWTAAEAQAVGWVATQKAMGVQPEFVRDIVGANTKRVSIGLAPGEGTARAGGPEIPAAEAHKVIKDVAEKAGVKILASSTGVGAYLQSIEGSIQVDAFASPEAVKDFLDMLGYALQQTEVIATKPLLSGDRTAIDVMGKGLDQKNAVTLFNAFLEEQGDKPLAPGFQQIEVNGVPGIRLLNFGGKWEGERLLKIYADLDAASAKTGIVIDEAVDMPVRLESAKNDWNKEPGGEAYLRSLAQRGRDQEARWLADRYGTPGRSEDRKGGNAIQPGQALGVRESKAEVAPPFYSALERGLEGIGMNSAPAAQWKATIKNLKGVSQKEIEATELNEWLDLQGDKVTKAQILDFVRQNGVQVRTKVANESNDAEANPEGNGWDRIEADTVASKLSQYRDYQLPGGSNHQVMILTLPSLRKPWRMERTPEGGIVDRPEDRKPGYQSPHWPVMNVLAHVRMNDRVDSRGRRVLFIEEIQSDWAQKGKKQGFANKADKAKAQAEIKRLEGEVEAKRSLADKLAGDTEHWYMEQKKASTFEPGNTAKLEDLAERVRLADIKHASAASEFDDLSMQLHRARMAVARADSGTVPSAPFVTNTDAWVTLALKRMIRYAAEEGYDSVAFVNGEQSAERYDLSRQVKQIIVRPVNADRSKLDLRVYDHNDNTIVSREDLTLEQLPDIIGKDATDKAIEQLKDGGHADLRGLDLKVGGEGMKAFYDKIVPSALNKLLGKLGGGKVGKVSLPEIIKTDRLSSGREGGTHQEAPASDQPGFDITPEMRESVMQGQPLFVRSPLPKGKSTVETIDDLSVHTMDTILPEIRDRRRNRLPGPPSQRSQLLEEHNIILSAAIADLYDAGMHQSMLQGVDGFYTYGSHMSGDSDAQFIVGTGFVGIREDHLFWAEHHPGDLGRAQAMRGYLAHEIWHAVDNVRGSEFISESSPRLGFFYHNYRLTAMGDLMSEVASVYEIGHYDNLGAPPEQGRISDFLTYPMAKVDVMGASEFKTEILAQMGRLYYTNPALMERHLPLWFSLMKEVNSVAAQGNDLAATRRALSQALRSRSTGLGPVQRSGQARGSEGAGPADGRRLGVRESGPGVGQETDTRGADLSLYIDGKAPEKYAGNINLDRIAQPDDIKKLIHQTAQEFAPEIESSRRGTISHNETKRLAAALGMTPEMLLERNRGKAYNSEEAYAARSILVNSAIATRAAAAKAATGSEADLAEWMAAVHKHAAIEAQVAGIAAEAGRALNQFRILAQALADAGVRQGAATSALEAIGEQGVPEGNAVVAGKPRIKGKVTPETIASIVERAGGTDGLRQVARTMSEAQNMEGINEAARAAAHTTKGNPWLEAWKAMLLSGPRTHAVNMLSNSLVIAMRVPEATVAGLLGSVHGGASLSAPVANMIGFTVGVPKALMAAARVLKNGEMVGTANEAVRLPAISSQNLGYSGLKGKFVDAAGNIIRLPFRFLSAEDQFFRTVNEEMERYAIAARAGGLRDMAAALANPTAEQSKRIEDAGLYYTFNKELGTDGKKFQMLLHSGWWQVAQLIMPFVRTPINIVKFAGERTPFALASKNVRREIMAGGERADLAIAKIITGSAIAYWAYSMAAAGLLTGGGDPDKNKKRQRREAGIPDYSFKLGDTWYQYRRLEPLGMLVGTAGDMYEMRQYLKQEDNDHFAAMLSMAIAQNLTSKTFLKGISDFVNATGDTERYGANYAGQYVGSLIPSFIAQYAGVEDDVAREAYGIMEQVQRRVPGQREKLQPKIDTWGEAVPSQGYLGPDYISPIATGKESTDPVRKEVNRLHPKFGLPGKEIQGVKLTPEQITQYRQLAGQMAHQGVSILIAAEGYDRLPDWARREAMEQIVRESHAAASTAMVLSIGPQKIIDQKVKAYK